MVGWLAGWLAELEDLVGERGLAASAIVQTGSEAQKSLLRSLHSILTIVRDPIEKLRAQAEAFVGDLQEQATSTINVAKLFNNRSGIPLLPEITADSGVDPELFIKLLQDLRSCFWVVRFDGPYVGPPPKNTCAILEICFLGGRCNAWWVGVPRRGATRPGEMHCGAGRGGRG